MNSEGDGAVSCRDLINNSLSMRPDCNAVDEVRDVEVLDMLSACNTGHDWNLSTGYSNSPKVTITRLETMAISEGNPYTCGMVMEMYKVLVMFPLNGNTAITIEVWWQRIEEWCLCKNEQRKIFSVISVGLAR